MFEEEKEEQNNEKIGFNSAPINYDEPDVPVTKKKTKFSNQRKSPIQKATYIFFIFAAIFSVVTFAFFMMPVLSALAGVLAFFIIGAVILIPILATAFVILASEDYRIFVGKAWRIVEWFFDAPNHIAEFSPYFPYVAFPALALDAITIVLCIVTLAQGKKGVVTYLIFSIIFFLVISVVTIFFYANGMSLIH